MGPSHGRNLVVIRDEYRVFARHSDRHGGQANQRASRCRGARHGEPLGSAHIRVLIGNSSCVVGSGKPCSVNLGVGVGWGNRAGNRVAPWLSIASDLRALPAVMLRLADRSPVFPGAYSDVLCRPGAASR
jgi:hypothetical protein